LNKFFQIPLVRFLSSVKVALPMILLLAVLLATGTILESLYTASIAKRFVYGTWWFDAFLLLLGVNVLGSALSRFPWKKHQTGFVITHLGILCVLAGSFITQQWGTDGQIALAEGAQGLVFQEDKPVLSCQVGSSPVKRIPAGFQILQPGPSLPFSYTVAPKGALKIDRFFLNAQKVTAARPALAGEPGTLAVHLKLQSSFVQQDNWLFLGKDSYDRVDLGPASVLLVSRDSWKNRLAKEAESLPENVLALIVSPDGMKAKTRKHGIWGDAQSVKTGESLPTGWMDMRFEIAEQMKKAVPDISYAASPLVSQKEPQPALHFEAEEGRARAEGWLGFEDQMEFALGGQNWKVTYGPRQAPLPFAIALQKFKLGLDPGTENPASYTSEVKVIDLQSGAQRPYTIFMNHPLHQNGYTLYQASYFPGADGRYTSVFSVGRDPGLLLKYGGALIMVLGIILMFWFKNPAWKKKETDANEPDDKADPISV
jgi:hypothetical protein